MDPCLFYTRDLSLIIVIYVDDGIVICKNVVQMENLLQELGKEFQITHGALNRYLGMEIKTLDDGSIFLNQGSYAQKLIRKFGFEDLQPSSSPADKNVDLDVVLDSRELKGEIFREAVGSLMYLSTMTRPDIAFAVSKVSQYTSKPHQIHWNAVKRIFSYLKGTANYGILYSSGGEDLEGFSDADYARDKEGR